MKDLAKVAYDAYCETTGWKSAITGAPLPEFHLTPEAVQVGWEAAARAVTKNFGMVKVHDVDEFYNE